MLETPKDLNTTLSSKNFKYITMDNQQETNFIGSSETTRKIQRLFLFVKI